MPPPPPPPAPPPIPKQAFGGQSKSNNFEPPPDRNALLSQIKKGTRLKKTETNDRSGPIIDGSKSSNSSSNGTAKVSTGSKSNGPFPIIPPGGLFAQGIPKLRPTGTRTEGFQSSSKIQSIKTGNSTVSSLDHLRIGQLGGSRSQPPSPVSKPRMASGPSSLRTESSGNPNFPDDLTIKGPAPAPPPASQKPVFKTGDDQPPSKPTVKRSASQTNLGQRPRLTRPPPNVKPPPPPKTATPTPPSTAPPPPPSKPPNILRRQSFGVGEGHSSRMVANKLSVASDVSKPVPKTTIGAPPPPPRNNSAPNDLNKIVGNSSSPNIPNHVSKMNIAPPPPPPNRAGMTPNRGGSIRPPPPRAPAPPPPPPQHHFNSLPAPPSQMKATVSSSLAPPPPARVSSMKQSSSFEDRFNFQSAQSLPKPERYSNIQKSYPSRANRLKQSTRRLPPPPPPQSNTSEANRGQSVLHIQLNAGIFSNNYTHS